MAKPVVNKNDSRSEIPPTLETLIANKPNPAETAPDAMKGWLATTFNFFRRGSHECFLAAWHVGSVLSPIRAAAPHGNRKNREALSWPEWVEKFCPFTIETANRWVDIFDLVKPDNVRRFDELTYEAARELVKGRKGVQSGEVEATTKIERGASSADSKTDRSKTTTLGSAVSQVRNSALKLISAVEHHDELQSMTSGAADADRFDSFIAECLKAAENTLVAAEHIVKIRSKVIREKHDESALKSELLNRIKSEFAALHYRYLGLNISSEEEAA